MVGNYDLSPDNTWGVNAWIDDLYNPGGHINDLKPFYYWIRDRNMSKNFKLFSVLSLCMKQQAYIIQRKHEFHAKKILVCSTFKN